MQAILGYLFGGGSTKAERTSTISCYSNSLANFIIIIGELKRLVVPRERVYHFSDSDIVKHIRLDKEWLCK